MMLKDNIDYGSDSLSAEVQELAQDRKELQDEIQCFEYKNKSRDGKYYVFSYNTISSDGTENIKRKYVNQYGGSMEKVLVTDVNGKVINDSEFIGGGKVYIKAKMSDQPNPIDFKDVSSTGQIKKSCTIKFQGWDSTSIKQIYQDEFNLAIEDDRFVLTDNKGNIYDNNHKFNVGDTVFMTIKEKSDVVQANTNGEDKENQNRENSFKEMIEMQRGPVTHGNKEKPEISITIDDGNGAPNIKHILDTLRGSGIRATFFILGTSIKDNSNLWKQAIEEGHQVCCHTYSHIYLSNKSDITDLRNSLKKEEITKWENNVKNLLGVEYYNKLQFQVGNNFPYIISSPLLLRTEILMWEAQIKESLGEPYLEKLKSDFPFFRFPGGNGWLRERNIKVLRDLGYLSIGWSDDFYRGIGKNRKHMTVASVGNLNVTNGDIPLFHFKESDFKYIDTYINNIKKQNKTSHLLTETLTNK